MTTTPFNDGWTFRGERSAAYEPVSLPHDAMIGERRSATASSWAHGAYFPGGRYYYRRSWTPGAELSGKEVSLRFEGVYRRSRIRLDGRDVGGSLGGYREFEVRLDPFLEIGGTHTIDVEVDNSATPSARWYTGSGIYRPVWLEVRDRVHVMPGGVTLGTELRESSAQVSVDVDIANPDALEVGVDVSLRRSGGLAAIGSVTTARTSATLVLDVSEPHLWSADSPALYDLDVVLRASGSERDRQSASVGLRVVELDPRRGLVVNGHVVDLRGANIHHDSGVLGAATFPEAERRRVRILKESGFNAIRSAHNPASRALLDACDEHGMYVVDEVFDGWYDHKTDHDDAQHFDQTWRDDVASMVLKDRCHPSVVMYSIGNENGEAFSTRGRRTAAALVGEVRRLDPTRHTTIGVNLVGAAFAGLAGSRGQDREDGAAKVAPDMTSTALNVISNRFGALTKYLPRMGAADRATHDLFHLVDVAGYNYGTSRYQLDASLHPDRLMVGTESMPGDLARNWALVERLPSLIGDFVWAGWDYLGEAGGGSWVYGTRRAPFLKPFPQLASQMGIIDITGQPGAALLLAQAAWGTLTAPGIAVRPLDVTPGPYARTSWRSTDAIQSWSWAGHEGERADLEVYSREDEVEVLVNNRSLGRRPAGHAHGYLARFRTRYERGVVEAIGYRRGVAVSRSALRTAGPARLRLVAEGRLRAGHLEVAYVRVELADEEGVVDATATDVVTIHVDGPATIAGCGNGDPRTRESFVDPETSTHRGRAQVVVRSTGAAGQVTVVATSRSHGSARLVLSSHSTEA